MANDDVPQESQSFDSRNLEDDHTKNDQNDTNNNRNDDITIEEITIEDISTNTTDENSVGSTIIIEDDPSSSPDEKLVEGDQTQSPKNTDEGEENNNNNNNDSPKSEPEIGLDQLYQEMEEYISKLYRNELHEVGTLEIPQTVGIFLEKVSSKITEYEPNEASSNTKFGQIREEDDLFLSAIDCVSKLIELMKKYKSQSHALVVVNEASCVLQCAMSFFEDELHFILEEAKCPPSCCSTPINHEDSNDSIDKANLDNEKSLTNQDQTNAENSVEESESSSSVNEVVNEKDEDEKEKEKEKEEVEEENSFPFYSDKDISTISSISRCMISAGYGAECLSVFAFARRSSFLEELNHHGLEKISVDDIQKMQWDQLEGEIGKWVQIVKYCSIHLLTGEENFYRSVFPKDAPNNDDQISSNDTAVLPDQHQQQQLKTDVVVSSKFHTNNNSSVSFSKILFTDLSQVVAFQLVTFAEAVAMSTKSTEKLFKILDMYEALNDLETVVDKSCCCSCTEEGKQEIKSRLESARSQLGSSAAGIFYELEMSIKNDNNRQPVPNGTVHPLTRYIMNYLKYACEYKDTLEDVFHNNQPNQEKSNNDHIADDQDRQGFLEDQNDTTSTTLLFSAQTVKIMGFLDANLDAKSKLYKDDALRNIFLMNNGRYMLQKMKGTPELQKVVGEKWYRSRSMDMRSYHKNYQRETWGRVLKCLTQEGLVVKGKVDKPVLKERFKNFNQIFDEILRTQSSWVVSDEQLQSELRVSISAVMIPAYRGFVGRFGTNFTPGRQYEKYVKYQPEDIEDAIEQLFEGKTYSMARKR